MTYYILADKSIENAVVVHGLTTEIDVVRAFCKGNDQRGFYEIESAKESFTYMIEPSDDFVLGKDEF